MTMDHQSFVGAGQYVLPHEIRSRVVGCLTDPSRMDEQCVGGGQLITGSDVAPTVTAKWAKGSGGPSGSETGNLVVEKRERERVVSALTQSIQNGVDVRNAQAGHLIVEPPTSEESE